MIPIPIPSYQSLISIVGKRGYIMNHIYKVIWNHAKHCYTVVSEIAKNHSDSTKRVRMGTTAALMAVAVLTGFAMPAQAAVSIGTDGTVKAEAADINALNNLLKNGVTTTKDGSVTVGGLTVKKNGEVSVSSPDVVYGKNAKINWDGNNTTGQISIGNKAMVVPGRGGQERAFAYDGDATHAAGAIAIGTNTYARTGSIMIGSHVYKGDMGDVKDIDTDVFNTGENGAYGHTVNSTTIGTNSFTKGNLATTIGDYNIQSGKSMGYNDREHLNFSSLLYGAQNFGATVLGALNSNESQSATISGYGTSGVANSIVGVANRVNSSNGTLVFGAGNEVTNSLSYISGVGDTTSLRDAKNAQDILKKAVNDYDAGGAVLAIGGANKADWAQKSQLIGVGNTLTGASSAVSEYNMINGYRNKVTNATHTSIIGSNNTAENIKSTINGRFIGSTTIIGSNNTAKNIQSTIVMGDENTLEGRQGVISLGNKNTIEADNAVAIGHDAIVRVTGGLALGISSVSDREIGTLGYLADKGEDSFTWKANGGAVSVGSSSMTRQIINVAAGTNDTDAVNVAQLKKALESLPIDAGPGIKVEKITEGGKTTYKISTNIVGSETTTDTTTVTTNQTNTGSTGTSQGTTTGTSTKVGETVTVSTETKATHFGADDNKTADVKPGQTLNINGDKQNISTSVNGNSIKVELKNDIKVESVTANSVTVGDTSISTDGLTIQGGPSITKTGIDGGNQKVTGVEAGEISSTSTDAVNGSQLFATNQQVAQNAQSINRLGNRINKVGAGAAALAALHPLDFDPDDKWDFAAGYGNYNGENAAAIGAYYRPNEDTMFSVGGSFGNGENMVNAGVSLKLGQGNHVSTSKVAMAKEIKDLRKELEGLKSALLDANAGKKLDTSKLQLFPDVPKNHWAYEYVSTLKGNGALTGYPDGEFKGDRPMTRYEFATMLYKAMLEGATLSDRILKEFAPELERFTVDTVHQDKDGKPTVERVRTVKAEK